MKGIIEIGFLILIAVLVLLLLLTLSTLIIQWAWNIFMSPVFHLKEISFIQAFGLSVLIGAITSSFRIRKK